MRLDGARSQITQSRERTGAKLSSGLDPLHFVTLRVETRLVLATTKLSTTRLYIQL
jgi:hypothetical protein